MPIRFINGEDRRVNQLVILIYGAPNVGKTTLALTANNPALFDFDDGGYRAGNRKGKKMLPVTDWRELESLNKDDMAGFDTIVIDTVGRCLDVMAADIIRNNPKTGVNGTLTLQGYGQLKSKFKAWLDSMRSYGKDVVLVAHGSEESRGEETVERIYVTGGSKQEVYQQSDLIGFLFIEEKQRRLSFDPSQNTYGKNVGLPNYVVLPAERKPHTLADIIKEAKLKINDQAVEDQEEHERLVGIRKWMEGLPGTAEAFNAEIKSMVETNAGVTDRHMIVEVGRSKGLLFDRKNSKFQDPEPPETQETQQETQAATFI